MKLELSPEQKISQLEFRRFAKEHVAPHAARHDQEQQIPPDMVRRVAERGYLAPFLPQKWGGQAMEMVTYGLLHEEMGSACSSVRSLFTVHDMAALSIYRWGSDRQREAWLPKLAIGEITGALALSEPNAGSDVGGIETTAAPCSYGYLLNGQKKWITFGQIAGLFVVLAKCEGKPTAFLVEQGRPGFSVKPISGMLGTRGSMLALLTFEDCRLPEENLIARRGFGASSVALTALGLGRYSVACGSLGIAQACLDACLDYSAKHQRFGSALKDHQLIQQLVTDMITETAAARLLCRHAGYLKDQKDPGEIMQTFIAKYYASTAAMKAALNAVQIHGANGCSGDYPVERYLRDAKIMEIIEGSTQIQQITIAKFGFQEFEQNRMAEENLTRAAAYA
jgi:alkylation response protein AidB-like acyl-CoA dehydrogenase